MVCESQGMVIRRLLITPVEKTSPIISSGEQLSSSGVLITPFDVFSWKWVEKSLQELSQEILYAVELLTFFIYVSKIM